MDLSGAGRKDEQGMQGMRSGATQGLNFRKIKIQVEICISQSFSFRRFVQSFTVGCLNYSFFFKGCDVLGFVARSAMYAKRIISVGVARSPSDA